MNYYVGDFPPNEMFAPKGWICPKCGRVYSPSTSMCFYCSDNNYTITTEHLPPHLGPLTTGEAKSYTVGGSDYWDMIEKAWKNKLNHQSNRDFLEWYVNRDKDEGE